MKAAYGEEVSTVLTRLEAIKTELETWYAKRIPDNEIVDAIKVTYDDLMTRADQEINSFTGTYKTIRTAIVPQQMWVKILFTINAVHSRTFVNDPIYAETSWLQGTSKAKGQGQEQSVGASATWSSCPRCSHMIGCYS